MESSTSNSPGTNQTTSGPGESCPPKQTVDGRVAELDRELDDFERTLGLVALAGEDEVTVESRRLQSLPPSALKKMSALECGEAAYCLGQFAHRLQQALNREQGRVRLCEEAIKKLIARKVHNYRGVSFEERKLQAVCDDDAAQKWDQLRVRAQLRIERVSYLSSNVQNMAKTLLTIQATKRGRHED